MAEKVQLINPNQDIKIKKLLKVQKTHTNNIKLLLIRSNHFLSEFKMSNI